MWTRARRIRRSQEAGDGPELVGRKQELIETSARMVEMAAGSLAGVPNSLRGVFAYTGSRGTFNRVAGSTRARSQLNLGMFDGAANQVTNVGDQPRRFAMPLSERSNMLDGGSCGDQAMGLLTNCGVLDVPAECMVRAVHSEIARVVKRGSPVPPAYRSIQAPVASSRVSTAAPATGTTLPPPSC